jgi:dGTP triphosphohydrolase
MLQYIPNTMGIKEKTELENARNELAKARAALDYIAMMADVELLEEDADDLEGGIPDEPEI